MKDGSIMEEHPHITKAKELIEKLSKHCVETMPNKEFSTLSKLPWKVMMFVNSMNWRMKESSEAAILLLESDLTHPSLMLIRSCMENAAIIIKLADIIRTVIERKRVLDNDDEDLMCLLFANNYPKDNPYFEPDDKRFKANRIGIHVTRADELYPGFKSYYKSLSEFVHPNSDGVGLSYSMPHIVEGYTCFGPVLNSEHELYEAFTITLVLALQIYLDQINSIDNNLEDFIHLCDIDIVKGVLDTL